MLSIWRRRLCLFAVLGLITGLLAAVRPAAAQEVPPVVETKVTYAFGGQATFWARVQLPAAPAEALVFFRPRGETRTTSGVLSFTGDEVVYVHDLVNQPLIAFSNIDYWFAFRLPSGETLRSEEYHFYYEDNRFTWQTLDSPPYSIHWYAGDLAFGQLVLDELQSGLRRAQNYLEISQPQPVQVYVYASAAEMQSTLRLGALPMVGGHASPALGVMVVSLPGGADQRSETGRQVPHELMHLLLYQKLGPAYTNLPTWLNEGLASINESLPNPEYRVILNDAVQRKALLSFSSLCRSFPMDASNFYLSYAQSDSFLRFLHRQYGASGLESLAVSYANGLDCSVGVQSALNRPLEQLEADWRSGVTVITGSPTALPQASLSPLISWLVLLAMILLFPLLAIVGAVLRSRPARSKKAASPG